MLGLASARPASGTRWAAPPCNQVHGKSAADRAQLHNLPHRICLALVHKGQLARSAAAGRRTRQLPPSPAGDTGPPLATPTPCCLPPCVPLFHAPQLQQPPPPTALASSFHPSPADVPLPRGVMSIDVRQMRVMSPNLGLGFRPPPPKEPPCSVAPWSRCHPGTAAKTRWPAGSRGDQQGSEAEMEARTSRQERKHERRKKLTPPPVPTGTHVPTPWPASTLVAGLHQLVEYLHPERARGRAAGGGVDGWVCGRELAQAGREAQGSGAAGASFIVAWHPTAMTSGSNNSQLAATPRDGPEPAVIAFHPSLPPTTPPLPHTHTQEPPFPGLTHPTPHLLRHVHTAQLAHAPLALLLLLQQLALAAQGGAGWVVGVGGGWWGGGVFGWVGWGWGRHTCWARRGGGGGGSHAGPAWGGEGEGAHRVTFPRDVPP